MAGTSKQRMSTRVVTVLRKAYGYHKPTTQRSGLEELILGVINNGASETRSIRALNSLIRHFSDWNEARVAQPHELAIGMGNLPDAEPKGRVIRDVLVRLCDRTNQLSLDYLHEKGPREALRLVAPIDGFPESALARALMNAHGETVFPLTPKVVTVCQRLGLLKDDAEHDAMQRAVVRIVSKQSMLEFHWLLSRHAETVCIEKDPKCAECGLSAVCPTGKKILKAALAEAKTERREASRRSKTAKAAKKKSPPRRATRGERKQKTK